jgi:LysR family transcriptional regulator, nitrogen assimilation regulatory protein
MEVRQLRYFVKIIELRSVSRAAEVLHIAQPALGLSVRKLEDELHTQLLIRHSRGVEPTPAGKLLYDEALAILQKVEETRQAIRDYSGPARGVIHIGMTPSTHPRVPIELIRRSAVALPNIQIEVQEAMNATMLDWIRTERVDFGLVYLAHERPEGVQIEDLTREYAMYVHAPSEKRMAKTISFAEVCQHPLVMPGLPHHLRSAVETIAAREGLEPQIRYEIGSVGTILEMVERNLACSILPYGAVARHLSDGRVAARTIVDPELQVTMSLLHSPRRALSKAHVMLRAFLAEILAGEGAPQVSVAAPATAHRSRGVRRRSASAETPDARVPLKLIARRGA